MLHKPDIPHVIDSKTIANFDPTPIFNHLATQTALLDNVPTKAPLITAEYVLKRGSEITTEIKFLRTQLEKNTARDAALAGKIWLAILNDGELVLIGDLLIPHSFLPLVME